LSAIYSISRVSLEADEYEEVEEEEDGRRKKTYSPWV